MPGLVPAIAHRAAALDIEGDGGKAVRAIKRQGGDEFVGVALRIPWPVAIGPHSARLRVLVVDDAIDHAGGEKLALHLAATEGPARIGRLPIDVKGVAGDGDRGFSA